MTSTDVSCVSPSSCAINDMFFITYFQDSYLIVIPSGEGVLTTSTGDAAKPTLILLATSMISIHPMKVYTRMVYIFWGVPVREKYGILD